jgi:hypothetical protein
VAREPGFSGTPSIYLWFPVWREALSGGVSRGLVGAILE